MRLLSPLIALALVACSAAPNGDPVVDEAEPAAARSIVGEYVVTYVNAAAPLIGIAGEEPTVTIEADRIHFQSQCIYEDWSYTGSDEAIAVEPYVYDEPQGMCARGLAPGETAIMEAIGAADTLRFVQSGLWFSGPGGTVQMRRIPSATERAGRAIDLTGSWQVQALDERPLPHTLLLEADFEQIWWEPGCAGQSVSYTIEQNAFALLPEGPPGAVCEIGFPNELLQVWSALAAAETIERTANDAVLISGNGRSVLLAARRSAPQ